jgi:hypothetical protein
MYIEKQTYSTCSNLPVANAHGHDRNDVSENKVDDVVAEKKGAEIHHLAKVMQPVQIVRDW